MTKFKSLKDCKFYDSEFSKTVWITDSEGVKHAFYERQKSCRTVDVDELCKFALRNITKCDKEISVWRVSDREQLNFWLGYRIALVEFFNLEEDG